MLWHQFATRLAVALILGGLIGAERQWRQRTAGLRTNALVSAGASMFVMLSALTARPEDATFRIAGQVVSGIGFLGAGVILRNGVNITGLNTAATLWCSAAIGTLAGYGLYGSAFTGAIGVIGANILLRPVGRTLNHSKVASDLEITYLLRVTTHEAQEAQVRALLLNSILGQPLILKSLKSHNVERTQDVEVQAVLTSTGQEHSLLEQIVGHLSLESCVSGVSWEVIATE